MSFVSALLGAPRYLGHGAVQAASTSWRAYVGELLGDLAVPGKLLEAAEREVAETVVPPHQFGLVVRGQKRIFLVVA